MSECRAEDPPPPQQELWPPPRYDRGRSDEELVRRARGGDDRALGEVLGRYRILAKARARAYFLAGAEEEDVVQEAMIGLYKAVRDFDPAMTGSFRAFADLCVTRQVLTAVKTASRRKHGPLNSYVSLHATVGSGGDDGRQLADVLPLPTAADPADLLISAERARALRRQVDEELSRFETEVLGLYVDGRSYTEIADRLRRHVKSVDNALQRVKRKLSSRLQAETIAEAG